MFSDGISRVINSDLSGCEGMAIKELQVNEWTWKEWSSLKSEQCPVLESLCGCPASASSDICDSRWVVLENSLFL